MEIQGFYLVFASFRPSLPSLSERHPLSILVLDLISALEFNLFGFILWAFRSSFAPFYFSWYGHFKFHHDLVALNNFFDDGFFIFRAFGPASSFIWIRIVIFIGIHVLLIRLVLVMDMIFFFFGVLVIIERAFWVVFTFRIFGVLALTVGILWVLVIVVFVWV